MEKKIWTICHSTRSIDDFTAILHSFKIETLVDVRRFPGSKKFPQFNKDNLNISLSGEGIAYMHLESLGGRRKVVKGSENTAWRLASFQGYADHMASEEFKNSVELLEKEATNSRVAYMCSEAVWWSCHRSLISDYLKVRGWQVIHIMSDTKQMEHPYTKPARVINGKLNYTSGDPGLF